MSQQPLIYLTKDFFMDFIKQQEITDKNSTIEKRKKMLLIEELLIYKATICIDLSEDDYNNYMNPNFSSEFEEERKFQVYFNILAKQNKVEVDKVAIEYFRQRQYESFNKIERKPNYVFLSENSEFCKTIEKEFGVICLSKQLDFSIDLLEINKKTAQINKPVDVSRNSNLINHLPFSHTIKIVDPYLLEQSIRFIIELIKSLVATKVQIILTIEINNQKGKNISQLEQKIRDSIDNIKAGVPIISDRRFIHNRHITTNTFWLSSDYGFLEEYKKDEANWITYPLNKEYKSVN